MTTALTNVYSVSSRAPGSIPKSPKLIALATAQVSSTTVYADVIQVQWQSTDQAVINLIKKETASNSHKSAATPGSRATGVAAATPSASASSYVPSIGLSTGAKIGIALGVPLGIIGIAALVAFNLFRRRRRTRRTFKECSQPMEDAETFHELHSEYVGQSAPAELNAREVMELPGT